MINDQQPSSLSSYINDQPSSLSSHNNDQPSSHHNQEENNQQQPKKNMKMMKDKLIILSNHNYLCLKLGFVTSIGEMVERNEMGKRDCEMVDG